MLHWDRGEEHAFVEFPAADLGSFTGALTMEAEHGIKTYHALPHWKVWPDEPPVFTRLPSPSASSARGSEQDGARKVLPDDVINVHTCVEDRVGIERLEVEYRINDGPSTFEEIARGDGQLAIHGKAVFKLRGKVKDGDTFRWRLRASDNRRAWPRDRRLPMFRSVTWRPT